MNRNVVLFHRSCNDGFTAAYIASKFLTDCEFIAANYGEEPPAIKDAEVYILDFSYPKDKLLALAAENRKVVVLDHHLTAKRNIMELFEATDLENVTGNFGNLYVEFFMNKCGARLTLDYFAKRNSEDINLFSFEPLVDYVEDRDLWRWKLPCSREINAVLQSTEKTFDNWDRFVYNGLNSLVQKGSVILEYQRGVAERAAKNARMITLLNRNVPVLNLTTLISETLEILAEKHPFAMSYFVNERGLFVFSLRSNGMVVDVSEVAKFFGGGGHPQSAGFTLSIQGIQGCVLGEILF